MVSYAASKAALNHATKHLASVFAGRNVAVNAIVPGLFASRPAYEKQMAAAAATVPLQRVGGQDDIAGAVLYLASRASKYLTGHLLVVDGGMLLGRANL